MFRNRITETATEEVDGCIDAVDWHPHITCFLQILNASCTSNLDGFLNWTWQRPLAKNN